ncbi:hypothetical protein [Legionella fairfieldensis]|uniref:hypothetical protein n=1 Tax=Legionella fairfieldensis TaxID=45064 RepID=UPI00048EBC7D|nr:hypothetical protein [Legionella fairfieldensis]
MKDFFIKTFGGLAFNYYFRHWIFGLIFPIILFSMATEDYISFLEIFLIIVNTFLYPYSRFVYEKICNFILGDNFFIVNTVFLLTTKMISMLICWTGAIFIAPIGLSYLYYHHSKYLRNIQNS